MTSKGWTDLMPWKAIDSKEQIPAMKKGDILQIDSVRIIKN